MVDKRKTFNVGNWNIKENGQKVIFFRSAIVQQKMQRDNGKRKMVFNKFILSEVLLYPYKLSIENCISPCSVFLIVNLM